jgi:feruloyl esterase
VQNSLYHGFTARANTGPDGKPVVTADRLPLLHAAVVAACDTLDGQKDDLIADPRLCRFDPADIECAEAAADTAACLTATEVATIRKFYDGPRDPATGERLTVGGPQPGSELGWAGVFVPTAGEPGIFSEVIARGALKNLVFEETPADDYTLAELSFDAATFERLRARHPLFDATDPDLSAFADGGGKLILWHGWSDEHISPLGTIAYHEALEHQMGGRLEAFERLFLVPGMYHCSRGEGPSLIDLLTPMMAWVERGVAPEQVVARQAATGLGTPAAADRSRPLYPYPAVAVWDGQGDPDRATSYAPGEPLFTEPSPDWIGRDFFQPY